MLKTILSLLFVLVSNQEIQQPISSENNTTQVLLNDTNSAPIKLSKQLSHNRKLLDMTTTAAPNMTTTADSNTTTAANPTKRPTPSPIYHTDEEWRYIWGGVGAAGVFCLVGTYCAINYTCKKCVRTQISDVNMDN